MLRLLDTTLRDGGNVVGHGFSIELTKSIVNCLITSGVKDIELGTCKGLGGYCQVNATNAPTDDEYFDALISYMDKARIGMFMLASCAQNYLAQKAADYGLNFLRVGADAGDGKIARNAIEFVKKNNLVCRYSMMKAYILSSKELAEEAKMLQDYGVERITIMDSAGTMYPDEVYEYIYALKDVLTIPVGFHGHSNLGLAQANALAAVKAGADEIDCGLLGLARSAGNCSTELAIALFKRLGYFQEIDLLFILSYLEEVLIPAMEPFGYHAAVSPIDLMLGISGCHSSILPQLKKVAESEKVSILELIEKVSAIDRKLPNEDLMRQVAESIKKS